MRLLLLTHFDSLVDVLRVDMLWFEEFSCYGQLGFGASSWQSLGWTQIHIFCRGILCCTYCEVEVTFAFLCLPEGALGHLDSRFSLIIGLLMTRTAFPMLKAPFSSELSEL